MKATVLQSSLVPDVARLHQAVLPQTLNSRLGPAFLEQLYRATLADPDSRACVLKKEGRIAGFATATLDFARTRQRLFGLLPLEDKLWASLKILGSWNNFFDYLGHKRLERVFASLAKPYPTILTIGVDPASQGQGIGKTLLADLESFFCYNEAPAYFVDTRTDNVAARRFYEANGFSLMADYRGNCIYRKNAGKNP